MSMRKRDEVRSDAQDPKQRKICIRLCDPSMPRSPSMRTDANSCVHFLNALLKQVSVEGGGFEWTFETRVKSAHLAINDVGRRNGLLAYEIRHQHGFARRSIKL
jgi:hypothetical protein